MARQLYNWYSALTLHWEQIHFGNVEAHKTGNGWSFQVQVYLGEILPDQIRVELYADALDGGNPAVIDCRRQEKISGAIHGYAYQADIATTRSATDFTARVIPHHAAAQIPAEAPLIAWQH